MKNIIGMSNMKIMDGEDLCIDFSLFKMKLSKLMAIGKSSNKCSKRNGLSSRSETMKRKKPSKNK
jgi:hypothetical protein